MSRVVVLAVAVLTAGVAAACDPDPAAAFRVGACVTYEDRGNGNESLSVVDCADEHDFVIAAIGEGCPPGTVREVTFAAPDPDRPPLRYCLT